MKNESKKVKRQFDKMIEREKTKSRNIRKEKHTEGQKLSFPKIGSTFGQFGDFLVGPSSFKKTFFCRQRQRLSSLS